MRPPDQPAEFAGLQRFAAVDDSGEPAMFATFLDRVDRIADVQLRRRRSYELLGVRAGARLVDVGCGLGTAARELAALVGPDGSVIGVDASQAMIDAALERTGDESVVSFRTGDALALPLEDGSVDGYRAERLFQHLTEPGPALAEARRVMARGGRLVLVDQDWDALVLDADESEPTRTVLRAFCDSVTSGWIGRRFHGLLAAAGFEEVEVEAETVTSTDFETYGFVAGLLARAAVDEGAVSADVGAAWLAEQEARGTEGRWFMAMTHFLAAGRAP